MKLLLLCLVPVLPFALASREAPVPTPRAASYKADPVHSSAIFRVRHAGAAFFYGRFDHVEGELSFDDAKPEQSEVRIRVKADSVHTGAAKRDKHVRGPDFLDAVQFPWVTFTSDKVRKVDADTYEVSGRLEMRGVEKPVTMRVDYTGTGSFAGQERNGYETTFTIRRSEFGVSYGVDSKALGDEVRLTFGLEMIKQ